jgi:hypothetical protein
MNNLIIKELEHIILYYLREKEILILRLETSSLSNKDQLRIYKKLSNLNSKITTVKACISSSKLKFNYSNN